MTRTVVVDARIWTGDAAGSWSHAIAFDDDTVVALGDAAVGLRRTADTLIKGGSALIIPGFQDAHLHPPFAGYDMGHVWLNDLPPSRDAYLDAVARYAAGHPDEEWIVGGGWYMEAFPGGTPHKRELDAIVPDRPVLLMNRDVHGAWANSKALQVAGLTAQSPDPAGGRLERDESGELTGCLHEGAAYWVRDHVAPAPTVDDWATGLLRAQEYLHSLGLTGWQDAWVTPEILKAYCKLGNAGTLTARVVGAQWWERTQGLEQIERFVEGRKLTAANFDATRVKIMCDGVVENHTAAMLEPYVDPAGGPLQRKTGAEEKGMLYVEPPVLRDAVVELDRLGFSVHMHAIGDAAVRHALDAVEAARTANGPNDNRHHIAHVQVVHPNDIDRFARLGVAANFQALWACNDPQMVRLTIPFMGAARSGWQYRFAALVASGATVAMGSDWPVSTPNPLAQIEVAVNRVAPVARGSAPLLPGEAVPLPVALRAFTSGSAYVNGDDRAGALTVGARADLVFLDRDIFCEPRRIADACVIRTIAAGRVVYEAEAL